MIACRIFFNHEFHEFWKTLLDLNVDLAIELNQEDMLLHASTGNESAAGFMKERKKKKAGSRFRDERSHLNPGFIMNLQF